LWKHYARVIDLAFSLLLDDSLSLCNFVVIQNIDDFLSNLILYDSGDYFPNSLNVDVHSSFLHF